MTLPDKDKPYEAWKSVREDDAVRASVRSVLDALLTLNPDDQAKVAEDGSQYEPLLRTWIADNKVDSPAYEFDAS